MSAQRLWWRRIPRVLVAPAAVFAALRADDEDDLQARQEPILALVLLGGMAGLVLTPTWGELLDDGRIDGLLVVFVLTFVEGVVYGGAGYYLLGLALHGGARAAGSEERYRLARHVVAFAAVPLAASLALVPVGLVAFGDDIFRSGGTDDGAGGTLWRAAGLALAAWSGVLLAVGVRCAYRLAWTGVATAVVLCGVLVAAIAVLPSLL